MRKVLFATSNQDKLLIAQTVCSQYDIKVEQALIDIDEIQGEDPVVIVKDKALRAYEGLKKPVVVSDDSWDIPGLNGFPGPYMKSINKWFTPQNFINLMLGVEDRSIILHQYLAYCDGSSVRVFSNDIPGIIIDTPRGENDRSPNMCVTVLDHDNGKTIAEVFEQGSDAVIQRYISRRDAWHEFVDWYISGAN